MFKITDVRAEYTLATHAVRVYVDGLGTGDRIANCPVERAAAMLEVFNSGRDCYWVSNTTTFTTDPSPAPGSPSPADRGMVASWDVRIPLTGTINVVLSLLTPTAAATATSGNPAPAWATVDVKPAALPALLAMLQSDYVFYDNGVLRNTDFQIP